MSFDPSIFKAYDIRGTYPEQINQEIAYNIGRALVAFLKPHSIAVGRDMRMSSDELFEGLSNGINDMGVDVIDLGMISTDGLYYAVGKYGYEGGVMITASHNPAQYNGLKICRKLAAPLSGQDGLGEILKMIEDNKIPGKAPSKGIVVRKEIGDDYAAHCLSFIDQSKLKSYKIVIDAGNGMAGATLPPVLDQLKALDVTRLYFDLDGSFPNHPASPLEVENLVDLAAKIKETSSDFGVAFDGDADRMFLVDKFGKQVGGDMVTAMVSKSLLKKSPNETVLYNLICSRAVPELVLKMGGTPVRTKVGHALIKPLMKDHDAIFGGEHSGHFYFRDNWFADSGLIAFLVCVELLSEEGRDLHELVNEIDPYVRSGEINSRVESASKSIEKVAEQFSDGHQDRVDGLTVQYDDWWFNLRPSNTEPLLRLNIEADNQELLEKCTEKLLGIIRS